MVRGGGGALTVTGEAVAVLWIGTVPSVTVTVAVPGVLSE